MTTDNLTVGITGTRTVRISHDFYLSAPAFQPHEWIVHVAEAPSYVAQTGSSTEAFVLLQDATLPLEPAREHSALGRSIRSLRFAAERSNSLQVRTIYETTIQKRELGAEGPAHEVLDLEPDEESWYVKATGALDFEEPFLRSWIRQAGLIRRPREEEVHFARRVLSRMKHRFRWVDVREFDPGHRASDVCRAQRGDCAKLSLVYAAVLRASGVPTRILGVRWLPSGAGHIMTEFFARGIGWIPVDVLVDKEGEQRYSADGDETGFGSTTDDYFVHYLDDGFRLPFFEGDREILGLHSVAWLASGSGSWDGIQIDEHWSTA